VAEDPGVYRVLSAGGKPAPSALEVTPTPVARDLVGDLRLGRKAGSGRLAPETPVTGPAFHFGPVVLDEARRNIGVEQHDYLHRGAAPIGAAVPVTYEGPGRPAVSSSGLGWTWPDRGQA
jgi:hypothetical protein